MPETSDTVETRVARGVALLDRTLADWDQRIDLDRLDLHSSCDCILGQEFGDHPDVLRGNEDPYDIGTDALFADAPDVDLASRAHGFDRNPDEPSYTALTNEWRRVILARRGGAS